MASKRYWFRAKAYGWGWGLPLAWQGWLVYGAAAASLLATFLVFPPDRHLVPFMAGTWATLLLLIAVCWVKGEPPRWRWGK
ncbi:hypothetical protein [Pseudoxanthomonas sp.]|jgi:hypothetical protein|uniref:hypothetical protein n=1 Tax=Pseudoxanthomonas sp. TaxID=1871049 RepID=UPI002FE18100